MSEEGARQDPPFGDEARPLVLLIDDDEALRESLTVGLETYGYRITAVSDGSEAIRSITADPPTVILLDLFMPVMDGFEILRGLRALPACPPVIAISGGGQLRSDLLPLARDLGAAATLRKPFTIELLDETIRAVTPRSGDAPPSLLG